MLLIYSRVSSRHLIYINIYYSMEYFSPNPKFGLKTKPDTLTF